MDDSWRVMMTHDYWFLRITEASSRILIMTHASDSDLRVHSLGANLKENNKGKKK
jgi:hypothetical protein